jgi:hypothetical protein
MAEKTQPLSPWEEGLRPNNLERKNAMSIAYQILLEIARYIIEFFQFFCMKFLSFS